MNCLRGFIKGKANYLIYKIKIGSNMPRKFDDNLIIEDLEKGVKIKDIMVKYEIKSRKTIYDIRERVGREPNGRNPLENYLSRMIEIHSSKYDYPNIKKEFESSQSKITIHCKECGDIFNQTISHHIWSKSGCRRCYGNNILTINEILTKSNLIHGGIYLYPKISDEYVSSKSKITIICSKCGHVFCNNLHSHLNKKNGCSKCRNSKGEKIIIDILDKYTITCESQKRFDGCRNKNPLPFDFYLPKYNICIEFDGEQHFVPWRRLVNNQDKLKKIQINDSIKTTYCINNNIKLIRIKYTEINNIENIILSELKIN